jgi:exodeoxyribonuclease VII large subunit
MSKDKRYISLSQLSFHLQEFIEEYFLEKEFWVLAETTDVKNYPDRGYCFLSLCEKKGNQTLAKMEAVIWRQDYHTIEAFESATGMGFNRNLEVLLRVSVDYHAVFGLKLTVHEIDPSFTLGKIELRKQEVLQKLLLEYPELIRFENGQAISYNQELELPAVIKRLALISAPDSDGMRDFLHELHNNNRGYKFEVEFFPVTIQGNLAAKQISAAFEMVSEESFDVVVLARGGGSSHDLDVFDTFDVVLSIVQCPNPVICGIGHERNKSLCDLLANLSVKTPTKAAGHIIAHNEEFELEVLNCFQSISAMIQEIFAYEQREISNLNYRINMQSKVILLEEKNRLNNIENQLKIADPKVMLQRGYAMIEKGGKIISSIVDLKPGEKIQINLKDGKRTAFIES